MSEHIHIIRTKREYLKEIEFEDATFTTFICDQRISFSVYSARLDSLSKRLNNIINSGKKLTKDRLPVIVKTKTIEKFMNDEEIELDKIYKSMIENKEDKVCSDTVWKVKEMTRKTAIFIEDTEEDEVIIITI